MKPGMCPYEFPKCAPQGPNEGFCVIGPGQTTYTGVLQPFFGIGNCKRDYESFNPNREYTPDKITYNKAATGTEAERIYKSNEPKIVRQIVTDLHQDLREKANSLIKNKL